MLFTRELRKWSRCKKEVSGVKYYFQKLKQAMD